MSLSFATAPGRARRDAEAFAMMAKQRLKERRKVFTRDTILRIPLSFMKGIGTIRYRNHMPNRKTGIFAEAI